MATSFTSFKDLLKKAMPISKRGATWLDWNNTATSPIRYVNDMFYAKALSLDFFGRFSASTKTIPELLNDLYDPFHRNISITPENDVTTQNCYTINVPTYLAFGNWEKLMQQTLDRYQYIGVTGQFVTYATGVSHEAEDYINKMILNLVGDEYITDTEIWAIQFVYNQLKGAGILLNFKVLHLYSQSSKLNAELDFMDPAGAGLIEVAGTMDWNTKGTKSDGVAYYRTGKTLSTLMSDIDNHATVLHVSEDAGVQATAEYGVRTSPNEDGMFTRYSSTQGKYRVALGEDVWFDNTDSVGGYLTCVTGGKAYVLKDEVVVADGFSLASSGAFPPDQDYVSARRANGSVLSKSGNRICTWGRLDMALGTTSRKFVNGVLKEYNNRLNR